MSIQNIFSTHDIDIDPNGINKIIPIIKYLMKISISVTFQKAYLSIAKFSSNTILIKIIYKKFFIVLYLNLNYFVN
jgi:hypothetical protein